MTRLHEKFLKVPLGALLHSVSVFVQQATKDQQTAAATVPTVWQNELNTHDWFEHGFNAVDPEEAMGCYTEAIRLKPDFPEAYYNS